MAGQGRGSQGLFCRTPGQGGGGQGLQETVLGQISLAANSHKCANTGFGFIFSAMLDISPELVWVRMSRRDVWVVDP